MRIHTSRRFSAALAAGALLGAALFLVPGYASAQAKLSVSPSNGSYKVGELFSVLINVNTGGKSVNAASGQLNFDNQRLEVTEIGYIRSIFTIWTEEPSFSNVGGVLKFSGGVPSPGYTGSAGAVVRVTFKPKAQGQAPVTFVSGSVLANDGEGTNILDGLQGALYNIIQAAAATPKPDAGSKETVPSKFETADRPGGAPTITDWPKELEEGLTLTIKGLGYPNGKVLIFVQKGLDDPEVEERFAGSDGRFVYNFGKTVEAGLYRVWAKNVAAEGVVSASSEIVTVEVTQPLFFRFGTVALNYASIIVTLLALSVFTMLLALWSWIRVRRWQASRGKEISEAEKALHLGFDRLREGLGAYLSYLADTKSASGIKMREQKTKQDLKTELETIEHTIGKEFEDIKKP